ncbi:MAG: UDP-N-acetylmuramate--alanine ligase, partial [Isosphaeraceae bacterium]
RSAWHGADVRETGQGFRFRAYEYGRFITEITLARPVAEDVISALAALAASRQVGIPILEIREALAEFEGLERDFDYRGSYRGVTFIDDCSEEPAEIQKVVARTRRVHGPRRVRVVVAGARSLASGESPCYSEALVDVDHVIVMPGPDSPTGVSEPGGSGGEWPVPLKLELAGYNGLVAWVDTVAQAIAELDCHLQPGDVVLTLGAGDVGTIADAFIRRLSRDRPGG